MRTSRPAALLAVAALTTAHPAFAADGEPVDERPAAADEWGFHPADGARSERNPPSFTWRPQEGAVRYALQASRDPGFAHVDYQVDGLEYAVHCPDRTLASGAWAWRFRAIDAGGAAGPWSSVRRFEVPEGAAVFVLPARDELLARLPDGHPRLFVRPADLDTLRADVRGPLAEPFAALVARCEALLAKPPSTVEPEKYGPDEPPKSEAWRARWWGNRLATVEVLESAATLAFTWRVGGNEAYGQLARRLLLDAAAWDPVGATGYRYNDEAGMPYAYHFSRTYTWLHALLSEDERATCRAVMRRRGAEMFAHLAPGHLWKPYSSHSNRAWHFLGEVGIAFHGELPEADDWVWFAANVFANVYPVWSDADGGWHEGLAYWNSYLTRFTWWADVQRVALGLDAYALPFFSRAGDLPLYVTPPGSRAAGFGDLAASRGAEAYRDLMTLLATQAGRGEWQDWVERTGGPRAPSDWIQLLRARSAPVAPRSLADLPTSRLFAGTGVAALNTSLCDAADDVQVLLKASPFGTWSHGYESQNAFLLSAYGEPLFVRSGRRDTYGSPHHQRWMWQTKSVNSVLVDGKGQRGHSAGTRGRVLAFHTEPGVHYALGDATDAYGGLLTGFQRGILLLEPDLVLIHDRLAAPGDARFDWLLHAPVPFALAPDEVSVATERAGCRVEFLLPRGLELSQTDRYDPPPAERIQLVEHHLTASTPTRAARTDFVTLLRPFRAGDTPPARGTLEELDGGVHRVRAPLGDGTVDVLLLPDGGMRVERPGGAVDLSPDELPR